MRAKLHTCIGSWQVWVIVACLVYIWGVHGQGSRIAAVWPLGLWGAVGLLFLALLVLGWFALKYLVVPFLMFLAGMHDGRTAKAKEKFADSLMSFSTAVFSAIVISVLVFPFTTFIQAIVTRETDPVAAAVSWWPPAWWSGWHTAVFGILFWVPFSVAMLFRRRALDLYDEIATLAPADAPVAQGTHEQSTIPDPGPPAYVRANGGLRRRRHRRGR